MSEIIWTGGFFDAMLSKAADMGLIHRDGIASFKSWIQGLPRAEQAKQQDILRAQMGINLQNPVTTQPQTTSAPVPMPIMKGPVSPAADELLTDPEPSLPVVNPIKPKPQTFTVAYKPVGFESPEVGPPDPFDVGWEVNQANTASPTKPLEMLLEADKILNGLLGGDPDETISARLGRGKALGELVPTVIAAPLDAVLPGHTAAAYASAEYGECFGPNKLPVNAFLARLLRD